jgi:hypothetical protein
MRYAELIERELPKNSWEALTADPDKQEFGQELVNLVQTAYQSTELGSNVNDLSDVVPSDWLVLDWDKNPDVDTLVFYRTNRAGETWRGNKIQGIGHDGQRGSKKKAIQKLEQVLQQQGWWIEASDALRATLRKVNAPIVTDVGFLRELFDDPYLTKMDPVTYSRKLQNNRVIIESVFGHPVLS